MYITLNVLRYANDGKLSLCIEYILYECVHEGGRIKDIQQS